MESPANSVAAAESHSGAPSGDRLVIRVVLSKEPPQTPVRRRFSRRALLLLGAVAVVLSWVGVATFRTDPTSAPALTESAPNKSPSPAPVPARSEVAPAVNAGTLSKPAAETSLEAKPVESEVREQPDAPPSAIDEVLPDVPQSALDTIRGTVRVTVRVIVDKEGAVLAAAADDPGPSRYFERLSVEASKKWTFTPAPSEEQRIMLVKFGFTRAGATARASPL